MHGRQAGRFLSALRLITVGESERFGIELVFNRFGYEAFRSEKFEGRRFRLACSGWFDRDEVRAFSQSISKRHRAFGHGSVPFFI